MLCFAKPYERSLFKLTKEEQGLTCVAVQRYCTDPKHPSLRLHRLGGKAKGFISISPNMDLRVIIHEQGDRRIICYVDHHDPAMAWAERRHFATHEITGSLQLIEVPEFQQAPDERSPTESSRGKLFAAESDDYLLALGVPREHLPFVRALDSEESLLELVEALPEEAHDALLSLFDGRRPLPRPINQDGDPLATPDARRRFRTFESEAELARALERPWPEWSVYLHPTQREAVERDFKGTARVMGPAGTGKTVVAMHRAARLARDGEAVLLTTFSKILAEHLSIGMDLLMEGEEARALVTVRNLHAYAAEVVRAGGKSVKIATDSDIAEQIERFLPDMDKQTWSAGFLLNEWKAVIDFWGVRTQESYRSTPRKGRGIRLGARERDQIWSLFSRVRGSLDQGGRVTYSDCCEAAGDLLSEAVDLPFDQVVVDEAQDFGPRELAFCLYLSRKGASGLFFAGDEGQQIYKYPFSWRSIGLDIRGRSQRLSVNYRNSAQIRSFSEDVARPTPGSEAEDRNACSLFSGPQPKVVSVTNKEEERGALEDWVSDLMGKGLAPSEIAVLSRTKRGYRQLVKGLCHALEMAPPEANKKSDRALFAGTLHSAKGLEFRAVAIVGCEEGQVPLKKALDAEHDEEARQLVEAQERHLLYVGCTRARDHLLLVYRGQKSRFLEA